MILLHLIKLCETDLVIFDREREVNHLFGVILLILTLVGLNRTVYMCVISHEGRQKPLTFMQNVAPWLVSEFLANLPLHIVFSTLFATILYFMSNMRTFDLAANLFIFIATNILLQLVSPHNPTGHLPLISNIHTVGPRALWGWHCWLPPFNGSMQQPHS